MSFADLAKFAGVDVAKPLVNSLVHDLAPAIGEGVARDIEPAVSQLLDRVVHAPHSTPHVSPVPARMPLLHEAPAPAVDFKPVPAPRHHETLDAEHVPYSSRSLVDPYEQSRLLDEDIARIEREAAERARQEQSMTDQWMFSSGLDDLTYHVEPTYHDYSDPFSASPW